MLYNLQAPLHNLIKQTTNRLFIAPHPLLQPYIAHYTFMLSREQKVETETLDLIPDASGCIVYTFDGNRLSNRFWGPTTKTVTVKNDIIPFRLFIEFLPCGAYHLIRFYQGDLVDVQIPFVDLDRTIAKEIETILEKGDTIQELTHLLNQLFLSRLFNNSISVREENVVPFVQQINSTSTVQQISQEFFYSERHLNRIFLKVLGMSVKKYLRLLRINKIVEQVKCIKQPLGFLAQEAGYYDQAHFNHDFKSVCGVSPTAYRKNMSGFYNEEFKF